MGWSGTSCWVAPARNRRYANTLVCHHTLLTEDSGSLDHGSHAERVREETHPDDAFRVRALSVAHLSSFEAAHVVDCKMNTREKGKLCSAAATDKIGLVSKSKNASYLELSLLPQLLVRRPYLVIEIDLLRIHRLGGARRAGVAPALMIAPCCCFAWE